MSSRLVILFVVLKLGIRFLPEMMMMMMIFSLREVLPIKFPE
jgi:hypothetical protein